MEQSHWGELFHMVSYLSVPLLNPEMEDWFSSYRCLSHRPHLSHRSHQKILAENPLFPVQMHPVDLTAVLQWVTDVMLSLCISLVTIVGKSCSFNSSASSAYAFSVNFFFSNWKLKLVFLVSVFSLSNSSYRSVTEGKIHR